MKRLGLLVAIAVLALAGWMVYQHAETGKWSVLPVAPTPEEAAVRRLEAELGELEGKISAQERTAGVAGLAPTQALTDLYDRRDAVKAEIEKAEIEKARGKK